ncbi:MAG: serine/threonine protein kinase [Prosthecobacter sp.]|uniref:serine/threonine-protein kinase n=1 Tax=Prosthecobacter sp. TaxID=1965333 RepID=UPI0019ECC1A0|nr:serine/threonine-protein kinase [Prosthecobacter sp.]MBE2285949.1 serine/threonine protein kinase [Prosthecobacter sp.]
MNFVPEQSYLSTCPVCQEQIDVTSLEPFTKLKCPFCGQMVRVRRRFDHFMIVRQIGEGGMSRVFEAEDETLGRRVALKILNRQYSRDAIRLEQFRQEAHITANVNHPNVIKLYSVGYDQGYFYLAMELVGGGSLEQRIRREGHLKEDEALRIGREVAEGLRAAQHLNLIHRDVKPANILFTETGTAKVVDFGLALFANRETDQSGEIWATPYYVAPEKVIENKEDYRSDIFSLGATLYHAMTGNPPHKADTNAIEDLRRIKCKRVTLGDSGLRFSPRTEHVVNAMLSFRSEDRFANYDEVVDEMRLAEGLLDRGGVRRRLFSRRANLIGSVAAAISLAYGVGWLLREGGGRRATRNAIQISAADARDLTGGGVTLKADANKKSVSLRFAEALKELTEQKFSDSRAEFLKLADSNETPQPTRNWARFNAALCEMCDKNNLRDKKGAAIAQFAKLATSGTDLNGLVPFFSRIKERMAGDLGLGAGTSTLDYRTDNEELLGYLAHALAQWHFGDSRLGADELTAFQQKIETLKPVAGTTTSLDWLAAYKALVDYYKADFDLVKAALQPRESGSVEELRSALDEVEKTKKKLKTNGAYHAEIATWQSSLKREIKRMMMEEQRKQMETDKKRRQADLELLADVNALVPSLVQGYDYSRAIEMLTGTRLETADVRTALDGRIYLYTQSREFVRQLIADLAAKGWSGTISRREGGQMNGRITSNANGSLVSVTLDRGTLSIPFESLTPESLVEIAQGFGAQTTDSTDYYRRQETIAAFARLNGLLQLSTTIAAQLMEENRTFRSRWMKVMEAGI